MFRTLLRLLIIGLIGWGTLQAGARHQARRDAPPVLAAKTLEVERYAESWLFDDATTVGSGRFDGVVWDGARGWRAVGREGFYLSPVIEPESPPAAVVVEWIAPQAGSEKGAHLSLRWRHGERWSDWADFYPDLESPDPVVEFSTPLLLDRPDALQWRLELHAGERVRSVRLGVLPIEADALEPLVAPLAVALPNGGPLVIPRDEWGSGLGSVRWEPEPSQPRAIVIHHTATTDGGDNPAAVVRAIDVYHRVTRDWGDIGYHYLIDHQGQIYVGREGAPISVGAHAYNFNYGTVGIGLVGTFQEREPSEAARASLVRLVRWLSREYGIQPHGRELFYRRPYPSIMGHRDTGRLTLCPGEALWDSIPALRDLVASDEAIPAPPGPIGIELAPDGEWVRGTLTVTLTHPEPQGLSMTLRLDGETLHQETGRFQMVLDTTTIDEGAHELEVVAVRDGLESNAVRKFGVDRSTPHIFLHGPASPASATIRFSDELSGIARIEQRERDAAGGWSAWRLLEAPDPAPDLLLATEFDAATALQWRATDGAGNAIESGIVERPDLVGGARSPVALSLFPPAPSATGTVLVVAPEPETGGDAAKRRPDLRAPRPGERPDGAGSAEGLPGTRPGWFERLIAAVARR